MNTDDLAARLRSAAERAGGKPTDGRPSSMIWVSAENVLALLDERDKLRAAIERLQERADAIARNVMHASTALTNAGVDARLLKETAQHVRAALGTTEGEI